MNVFHACTHLIEQLPSVRGSLKADFDIGRLTWFGVGGKAEVMFEPADQEDLQLFLKSLPGNINLTVLGGGSNLIIRDGGIPGITIRLGRAFSSIVSKEYTITALAGAMNITVARKARDTKIGGLEFLSGIPGSVGGAVRMNAGAYQDEIQEVLIDVTALDRHGEFHTVPAIELGFSYRHCNGPKDWIFLSAKLKGRPEKSEVITARMKEISAARENSQPIRKRTGGSTFKNPEGHRAWQLIEAAGCRGLQRGGAQVSNTHCNFLINTGTATAADIEGLGEEVKRRVMDKTGVLLEWEIKRIGIPTEAGGA